MKVWLSFILLLLLLCPGLTLPVQAQRQITYSLEDLRWQDLQAHPEIVKQLSLPERENLAQKWTLDPAPALWGNLIPFGYGSFQQGDYVGGTTVAVMDTLTLLMLAGDLALLTSGTKAPIPVGVALALPLFVTSRVTGIVSPLLHAHSHNAQLRAILQLTPPQQGATLLPTLALFRYSLSY